MVLVPAGTEDVVPGCCLMAVMTLRDLRVWLACDARGDHLEMHHVMRWRRLMTLGTVS